MSFAGGKKKCFSLSLLKISAVSLLFYKKNKIDCSDGRQALLFTDAEAYKKTEEKEVHPRLPLNRRAAGEL